MTTNIILLLSVDENSLYRPSKENVFNTFSISI